MLVWEQHLHKYDCKLNSMYIYDMMTVFDEQTEKHQMALAVSVKHCQ